MSDIPEDVRESYRHHAARLIYLRANAVISPDKATVYENGDKPSEILAELHADQLEHYRALYPSLPDLSSEDLEIYGRATEFMSEQLPDNPPIQRAMVAEARLVTAAIRKAGPFKISDVIESTDGVGAPEQLIEGQEAGL
jgi:hypothetical protein